MDVEQPALVAPCERRGKDPHESRQRDEPRRVPVDLGRERFVEPFARRVRGVRDDRDRQAARPRELDPGGVGAVADHGRDRNTRLDQRPHVAAATGDEDDDAHRPAAQ